MRSVLLAIVLGALTGGASAQSLGDAARAEAQKRETRSTEGSSDLSFTQADLPDRPDPEPFPTGASETAVDTAAPETVPAAGNDEAVDEATQWRQEREKAAAHREAKERYWRYQAALCRAYLEDAQRAHDLACSPGAVLLSGG